MHIALISRDESLQHLCHGVLATLPIRQWKLLTVSLDDPRPTADLYLWDWEPRMCVPEWIGEPMAAGKHMLLIDRAQARRVFDELPCSTVTLVLKPVNSDALRAFLEQAAKHHDSAGVRRDRDTILDCLLAATLRLQEYDQDRMNFLARAVHDFRTPLTAVNGYCGLLLSGQFGQLTAAQREVLERTLHSVRRLSRLATALFQWSTGARVGLQSQIREADIEECCRQALHEVRPLAGEKSISIDLDVQPPGQPCASIRRRWNSCW